LPLSSVSICVHLWFQLNGYGAALLTFHFMLIELKVPEIGESVTEVEIGDWLKKPGESVGKDDPVVTLESDKATVDLPAPESGTVSRTLKQKGEVAKVGEVIAYLEKDGGGATTTPGERTSAKSAEPKPKPDAKSKTEPQTKPEAQPEAKPEVTAKPAPAATAPRAEPKPRIVPASAPEEPPKTQAGPNPPRADREEPSPSPQREEEVVPMSRLRRTVAERLVQAQRNAALLTTFNEIDMGAVTSLRADYGEAFLKKYRVKLGFMSFFVKACVDALKQFPALNAGLRGSEIIYHNYCDVGVAIGGGKGLVVPVLRNAERLSFAEIEIAIGDFARRTKENKIKPDELAGGTFTISNGGVYGSLLSTPIINPPQSGVLGMHAIQDRPVAREGNVVIRPMMYVALTYDHRLVDGREAVTFLKRIKEAIEAPARMLIEI
jgi:2-oxoglutarate dehydrogenase E2 component (dihydrolipoamide succinyltransferase)